MPGQHQVAVRSGSRLIARILTSPIHTPRCFQHRKLSSGALLRASSQRTNDEFKKSAKNHAPLTDHHTLGKSLDLFSSTPYSAGSPLLHPSGSHLFLQLQSLLRAQHEDFDFQEVITPIIYKQSLWERSGHLANYGDNMYKVIGRKESRHGKGSNNQEREEEDETWRLKPMNCPGHCLLYGRKARSHGDLPVRYADFSPLHRDEVSGSLSGLTRVRRFHQDDGHIFCRPDQVGFEISKTLQMINLIYGVLWLRPHKLLLSTRPETDYIGTEQEWSQAERELTQALDQSNIRWELNEGDGAFYGPKIDVILKDNQGKEHQTATIQLDFQMPRRFDLSYASHPSNSNDTGLIASPPSDALESSQSGFESPILIHRAVLGSLERFMALLIEHYEGHFPFWLSPRQIKIITTNDSDAVIRHAHKVSDVLSGRTSGGNTSATPNARSLKTLHTKYIVGLDDRSETLGRKFAQARREKWSLLVTIGPKEVEEGSLMADFSGLIKEPSRRRDAARNAIAELFSASSSAPFDVLKPFRIQDATTLRESLDFLVERWL